MTYSKKSKIKKKSELLGFDFISYLAILIWSFSGVLISSIPDEVKTFHYVALVYRQTSKFPSSQTYDDSGQKDGRILLQYLIWVDHHVTYASICPFCDAYLENKFKIISKHLRFDA